MRRMLRLAKKKKRRGADAAELTGRMSSAGREDEARRTGPCHDDDDEELTEGSGKTVTRFSQLFCHQAFICLTILLAWLLGNFGFSVAWVLLVAVAIHLVWWSSVLRLLDDNVQFEKLKVRRQRAIQHDESAEWLNFIINRWSILSEAVVFGHAKKLLESLFNSAKPSILDSVVVKEFTLGGHTPSVGAIKAFEVINGRRRAMPLDSVAHLVRLHALRYRVAIEADVDLVCPGFRMVLGLNSPVMGVDFVVTKLSLRGRVQLTLQFNADIDFPHISKATVTFLHKPQVQFDADQKILRSSLKTWANNLLLNVLTDSMVDPFRLELDLAPESSVLPAKESSNRLANGVLTVTLSLLPKTGRQSNNQEERWCTLKVGCQKHKTSRLPYRYSFLIESLADDVLVVKVKANRFIGTHTLETFHEPLSCISEDGSDSVERNLARGNVNLFLRMDYVSLPPPSIVSIRRAKLQANGPPEVPNGDAVPSDGIDSSAEENSDVVAGVLYILVHEADRLGSDSGKCNPLPNPYCVVIYNNKKVKTTHYILESSNPQWESGVELLVSDYSQVSFCIAVCSWDTHKMVESDFLGLATVNMSSAKRRIVRQRFRLEQSSDSVGSSGDASIVISVIFRPVPSVAHSGVVHNEVTSLTPPGSDTCKKKINAPLKMFLSASGEGNRLPIDVSATLASGRGLMEVTVLKAACLLAKDFNGFSDPYCEVKLNQEIKYKTSIKKKTLSPVWNERFMMELPRTEDVFSLTVWDYDVFSCKDFLGSVNLSIDDVQKSAAKDASDWFVLEDTKSGSVELKFRIISEGLENSEVKSSDVEAPPPNGDAPTNQSVTRFGSSTSSSPQLSVRSLTAQSSSSNFSSIHTDPKSQASSSVTNASQTTANVRATPLPSSPIARGSSAYASLHQVKRKMKKSLSQHLRRFRSEANVHEDKAKNFRERVTIEKHDASYSSCVQIDRLESSDASPDNAGDPFNLDSTDGLKSRGSPPTTSQYSNVRGTVIQATGLELPKVSQLSCRVRLMSSGKAASKTLSKSKVVQASPNPAFNLEFQVDAAHAIPASCSLVFDIRSGNKETVASKAITLQELFQDVTGDEVRTCLSLNSGATLEVTMSHGKEPKGSQGKVSRLLRSWSVHRIGKI